jgi:hypothetical protein
MPRIRLYQTSLSFSLNHKHHCVKQYRAWKYISTNINSWTWYRRVFHLILHLSFRKGQRNQFHLEEALKLIVVFVKVGVPSPCREPNTIRIARNRSLLRLGYSGSNIFIQGLSCATVATLTNGTAFFLNAPLF